MQHDLFTSARIYAIPLFLLAFACARKEPVVARIDQSAITLAEYKTAYGEVIKQPNVFDARALREQFLDELIDRSLLAREAEMAGLADDERMGYRLRANQEKNLRQAHYRRVIKPEIRYSEADVQTAYLRMNEERHIRHLFSTSKSGADSLYQLLNRGTPWDDLAQTVFTDPRLSANGGDLGWVDWEQMEYDLANTAFTLAVNEYAPPVASSYGWHILQVVDWRKTPLLSQSQYELRRDKARTLLESKLGDKLALAYIGKLMSRKKINVYPQPLRAVGVHLGQLLQRSPAATDQMHPEQLSDEEMQRIQTSLWDLHDKPLAEIDGHLLTVGAFIAALNYVPYGAVHRSLKTALDHVLRDQALTMEARSMGLEKDEQVIQSTALYRQNRLQMAMRLQLLAGVSVDESDLLTYYNSHYADKYPDMKFSDARDLIRNQVLTEKRSQLLRGYLQQLRDKAAIVKHVEPIHAWYDSRHDRANKPVSQ